MTTSNDLHLLTESDIKEHGVIERWRYIEKHREEQLKNVKSKLSSTDQVTLVQQINDKNRFDNNEEKLSQAYACDYKKHNAIVELLRNRQEYDRRRLAQDIDNFRKKYQQTKYAREYDLTDTTMLNIEDNSISGNCLYFEGEDRNKQDRERKQKDQMNRWITEQCRQKCLEVEEQHMADEAYDYNQLAIVNRVKTLEVIQMTRRCQLNNDIKAFNRALADQKQCQRSLKERMEYEDKKQEITNMLIDNILTEDRRLSVSQFGIQRPLLTHWKSSNQ
ncbi:hypothetical protein I4U23_030556 [Adineta vaga]|nr:hypothetical protein I4U23_030556 [Adineta vaga]